MATIIGESRIPIGLAALASMRPRIRASGTSEDAADRFANDRYPIQRKTTRGLVLSVMDEARFRDCLQIQRLLEAKGELLQRSSIARACQSMEGAGKIEREDGRPRWRIKGG